MQTSEKHRPKPQNRTDAVLSAVSKSHGSQDVQPAPRPANQALRTNRPITDTEKRIILGYSHRTQNTFRKYYYLLRSEKGLMWASGNLELTAFVRALWVLHAKAQFTEAA